MNWRRRSIFKLRVFSVQICMYSLTSWAEHSGNIYIFAFSTHFLHVFWKQGRLFFWYWSFCFLLIWISLNYLCITLTEIPLEANEGLFCCISLLFILLLQLSHRFSNMYSMCLVCGLKFMYVQKEWMYVSVCRCAASSYWLSVFHSVCLYCACSSHCIYLIMRRAKKLWDNSIFCSNWSFHLRAVLSNLISDKSVSHLQLNYNIELAFRLSSLV